MTQQNTQKPKPEASPTFTLEQMKAAFAAGKMWIWEDLEQTTTCPKFESFEDWFCEWIINEKQ